MASERTNRVAKNTLMLYFRMGFTMLVSLYTSRVIINTLGVVDYGINGVVAGTVGFLSFLIYSMNTATQRFLNVAMGKGDVNECRQIFSTSVTIHFLIMVAVVIIGEIVGLWLLYNKLVIPAERMHAAFWVFQFTIVTTATSVMTIPYDAMVVAHERMHIYAYLSILSTVLKLAILYMLVISPFDKLITYGFLYMCIALLNRLLYTLYCKYNFAECKYSIHFPRKLFKEMTSFAGWDIFGVLAWTCSKQGTTILLNIFFGPVVNAAKTIAEQVRGAINGFSSNFLMALRPQITKSYAAGDTTYLYTLMFSGAKLSFVLLYTIILPLIIKAPFVLKIWLKIVPDYTVVFLQIVLVEMIFDAMMNPLNTAALATGRIRYYGFATSVMTIMELPLCYVILKMGGSPVSVFVTAFIVLLLREAVQFYKLRYLVEFSYLQYLKEVQIKCLIVVLVSLSITLLISHHIPDSLLGLLLFSILCSSISLVLCIFLVFNKNERSFLNNKILYFFERAKNRHS